MDAKSWAATLLGTSLVGCAALALCSQAMQEKTPSDICESIQTLSEEIQANQQATLVDSTLETARVGLIGLGKDRNVLWCSSEMQRLRGGGDEGGLRMSDVVAGCIPPTSTDAWVVKGPSCGAGYYDSYRILHPASLLLHRVCESKTNRTRGANVVIVVFPMLENED